MFAFLALTFSFLCAGTLSSTALASKGPEPSPVYYFSAVGDDVADGRTPATAWRTLEKLGRSLPSGAEARLRRGDVFYGSLKLKPGKDAAHRTKVTAYGEGAAPVVSGLRLCPNDPALWQNVGSNLWRIVVRGNSNLCGCRMGDNGNVGYLKVDGRLMGRKIFRRDLLCRLWDFWDDHVDLVVFCPLNPALMARDIRLATQVQMVKLVDHMELDGIVVSGTGAHGANGTARDVRISNCAFREIGGSHLGSYGKSTTRYGNGIECWTRCADVVVRNCRFSDIYDVAFTMQGPEPPTPWENIEFSDNTVSNCTQAFEIWTTKCGSGVGIRNARFVRNHCVDTGRNWAYEVRPDKLNATPLLVYAWPKDSPCDILVKDNTFVNSRGALIFKAGGLTELPRDYRIVDNVIVGSASAPISSFSGKAELADAEKACAERIRAANRFVTKPFPRD